MAGVDHALPDTCRLGHHELADLLNAARDRYATEHGLSPSTRADLELERRAAAVRQDRVPLLTAALAAGCVALFAMGVELEAGGASRDALADEKWWTLLSANVLHVHVFHLLLNSGRGRGVRHRLRDRGLRAGPRRPPHPRSRYVAWAMVPAGLVYTFLMPRVSIGGHLGGLLAGFALAYLFERARGRRREPALA